MKYKVNLTSTLLTIAGTSSWTSASRILHREKGGSSGSSYSDWNSCLDYSCAELREYWVFDTDMPQCPGYEALYGSTCGGANDRDDDDYFGGGDDDDNDGGGGGDDAADKSGGGGGGDDDDNFGGGGGDDNVKSGGGGANTRDDDTYFSNGYFTTNDDNSSSRNDYSTNTNPYDNFQIDDCSTYSTYWQWDLVITCQSDSSYANFNAQNDSCQCLTAQILYDNGDLSCPGSNTYDNERSKYCPWNCPICHTCLSLLQCSETTSPGGTMARQLKKSLPYLGILCLLGLLLGGTAIYLYQRKRMKSKNRVVDASEFHQELMDESSYSMEENVWLAPVI